MLPTGNPILMALLAAYCALASPFNTRPDQVQAVINALKAQLKADNVTDASNIVNEAEASLWVNGILNDEIVAKLEQEIQLTNGSGKALTTAGGYSVDAIAEITIEYLNAKGAIQTPDQEDTANETAVLDTVTMKQVVDHGVKYWGGSCPDGSQAKACCVIL